MNRCCWRTFACCMLGVFTAHLAMAIGGWGPYAPKPKPEPPRMKIVTRDADGKLVVHDPGGYDPRTIVTNDPRFKPEVVTNMPGLCDGQGLCAWAMVREKVAPGSKDRELTPEEEKAFGKEMDRLFGPTKAQRLPNP